jgi:hypothetical protein
VVGERVYFYFMKNDPAQVREATRQHVRYRAQVDPSEWRRGPFSDRSGGLISSSTPQTRRHPRGWSPPTRSSAHGCWSIGG